MKNINKTKKNTADKLRLILDNPMVNTTIEKYEKNLESLRNRMIGRYRLSPILHETIIKDEDSLHPEVIIHEGKSQIRSKSTEVKTDESLEELEEFKEILFDNEELFEIEKIDTNIPEFIEVKQSDLKDDENIPFEEDKKLRYKNESDTISTSETIDKSLPEWEPVETDIDLTDENINEANEIKPVSFQIIEDNEKNKDEILDKDNLDKIKIFEEFKSIDKDIAVILYEKGFDSIDKLRSASIKDLTKIKDISRSLAKKIKNELEKETEWESVEVEDDFEEDIKTKDFSNGWDTPEDHTEPLENINVFQDIKSIDDKITNLLIKNNINSIEKLRKVTIKDLIQIKGIRRSTAIKIKKELKENYEDLDNGEWEQKPEMISSNELEPDNSIGYKFGKYSLYKKNVEIGSRVKRTIHFFSKDKPEEGEPIKLPDGYEVKVNSKTGVPYLRKKK